MYARRSMQVNVETCLGGVHSYENDIKYFIIIKVHQRVIISTFMVIRCVLYSDLCINEWYYCYIYLCGSIQVNVDIVLSITIIVVNVSANLISLLE